MSSEVFIYWRVAPEASATAIAAAQGFQVSLQATHQGLSARLYRRVDDARSQVTVMETYAASAALCGELLDSLRNAPWCPAERHVEFFEALD